MKESDLYEQYRGEVEHEGYKGSFEDWLLDNMDKNTNWKRVEIGGEAYWYNEDSFEDKSKLWDIAVAAGESEEKLKEIVSGWNYNKKQTEEMYSDFKEYKEFEKTMQRKQLQLDLLSEADQKSDFGKEVQDNISNLNKATNALKDDIITKHKEFVEVNNDKHWAEIEALAAVVFGATGLYAAKTGHKIATIIANIATAVSTGDAARRLIW